ncbi:hypothetical protein PHYBOEH_005239 [Phytophthora boehmeriae]|uniref:EamA domain-containing protein n=1 Tax=Phytophthora boehmeriae TaxID=109152 RepID=A0A8T1WLU6_9STRA|nr:hypothetical protein PHYBOEH_005239 [Phytophthora boehmeriae]
MEMISLPTSVRLALLFSLCALDIVDFYSKIVWLGPTESSPFKVNYAQTFTDEPLPKPHFVSQTNSSSPPIDSGAELLRVSGWTSYYDKCEELFATKHGESFHIVKATNCDIGQPFASEQQIASEVVLSASLRADSVAWVSCQLLFFHRRPPLCQENLVTRFSQRYLLTEDEVDPDKMAPINSQGEAELLRMLGLLSRSFPFANVVCSQGFQSTTGPGYYTASFFMCGSPNTFESAAVGVYAASFADIHDRLAWLSIDKLNVMGFELVSRRDSRSMFTLREKDGELVVLEMNTVNFSSFGHLYVVLLAVDVVLLIANAHAAFETSRTFGWGELVGYNTEFDGGHSNSGASWLLLYRSLYRSDIIVALTTLSALFSRVVGSPYAIIWNNDCEGQLYAVLAALRMWMLVLCSLNLLWGVFVRLAETRAYYVAQRTFVTPLEVLGASAFVISLETTRLFDTRYHLDGQLFVDSESFPGRVAVSNAYNEEIDGFATTPFRTLAALLSPLAVVVTESLALVVLILIVKSVYYRRVNTNSTAVADSDDQRALLALGHTKAYRRLPLEEMLGLPARAHSLVRYSFEIEQTAENGLTYIPPHLYYEFGATVSDARLFLTRLGFFNTIHRRLDVQRFFPPVGQSKPLMSTFIKYMTFTFSSMEAIFWRSLGAFVCNFAVVICTGQSLYVAPEYRRTLALRCIAGFACMGFAFYAMSQMVLADASVIVFTSPVMTFFFGAFVLHEKIDPISFVSAVVAFGGLICVVRPGFLFGYDHPTAASDGSWLAICSGLLGALSQVCVFLTVRQLQGLNVFAIVHYFTLSSIVFALLWIAIVQQTFYVPSTFLLWRAIIGTGLFTFGGQMFLTKGFQLEKAGIASVMRYLDVVFVFIWDATILGEHINHWSVIGALVICTCAVTIAVRKIIS